MMAMCTESTTGNGKVAKPGAADWLSLALSRVLSLAATPTFALMALLAAIFGDSGMHGGLADSMALMYLLMSVFHAAPWLRWLATRCP